MRGATIRSIGAREILDSRGNPTLEVWVRCRDGTVATAAVPSGASTGSHEAHELRDGGRRYGGRGVRRAVRHVAEPIARAVVGMEVTNQRLLDERLITLDGTPLKSRLGANAILGVSLAAARAAAALQRLPLYRALRAVFFPTIKGWRMPVPMFNVINGGAHAGWNLDVQEFLLLPQQRSVSERVRCGVEVFHALGAILTRRRLPTAVGDEGGYAPQLPSNEAALQLLIAAIRRAGYQPRRGVKLGIDLAASSFFRRGRYCWPVERRTLSRQAMVELLVRWRRRFGLATIEDGMAEDDWQGWQRLTRRLSRTTVLIGDDLFVTNVSRLRRGVELNAANAILVKPNQVGTLTETVAAIQFAQTHGYQVALSHRSGETTDDFIVDLAVAAGAEYLKAGAPCRGERVAKWNRLLAIEGELKVKN